ncbi:MAG: hypothetical protein N3A71_02605 [Candidatus Dojkabacteria bacterium]|nr:hypothetical protein [Candidatus Dojkabacteria bacterium]
MAKKQKKNTQSDLEEDALSIEEESNDSLITDVSLEEILKNPEKYTDVNTSEEEEIVSWCPDCVDHRVFVNGTCTTCGYIKKSLTKSKKVKYEDLEESESKYNPDAMLWSDYEEEKYSVNYRDDDSDDY